MGLRRVAAIVLHYNSEELTAGCCHALAEQSIPADQILVVDNGSTPPLSKEFREAFPSIRELRLPLNRGFSGGMNAGIRLILDDAEVTHIWLLNNDAVCENCVLENMLDCMEGRPRMAAAGCLMVEEEADGRVNRIIGGKFPCPFLRVPYNAYAGDRIDYLSGASLLIRKEALEDVGLLDENYFFFFEDADWCLRARKKGWELGISEKAIVHHKRSSTIGRLHRLRASYYRRSYIRFLKTYSKMPHLEAGLTTLYRLGWDCLTRRWESFGGTIDGWKQVWADSTTNAEPDSVARFG